MSKSRMSNIAIAALVLTASSPVFSATYYYWVDTVANKVVRGLTPASGVQTFTSSTAAAVYLTYYWVDPVTNVVNSGFKSSIPAKTSAYKTYAEAAKRVRVFWIDQKTMQVKWAYVGRQPLTVTQTYTTLAQAEGELPAYWVNASNKQIVSGKRKDVPLTEMYYSSASGAQEYLTMGGHVAINLSPVYRLGATGKGVKVAVVDSGVDASNTELRGRVDTRSGWDYVLGRKPYTNSSADPNGHGTHVAGIIAGNRNNSGFSGVAPEAQVVNFRILPASGSGAVSDSWLVNIVDRGLAAGVKIYSNSWGDGRTVADVGSGAISLGSSQRYKAAVRDSGAVFVWANGNEGKSEASWRAGLPQLMPELTAGWVAVASLDPNTMSIASYSNRCGAAAQWCLTAPGSSITSARSGGGSTVKSGTSMATPYVSGSIALLQSHFKTLTAQDVVARLFETADRSGIYSNSSIYGRGLMNVGAASQPIGGLWIPTGTSTTSSVVPLSSVLTLSESSQAAKALMGKLSTKEVVAVDGFSRATFAIPVGQLLTVAKASAASSSAPSVGVQSIKANAVSFALDSSPKVGLSARYFGGDASNGGSLMVSWSGPSYFLSGASGVPHSLLDVSSLGDSGLGLADMVRGKDPMSDRLGTGASFSSNLASGAKLVGSFYSEEQLSSGWRVGVEKVFSGVKVGLEGSSGALSGDLVSRQFVSGTTASFGGYVVAPLADRFEFLGGVMRGNSSTHSGSGDFALSGAAKSTSMTAGLRRNFDGGSAGFALRADRIDSSRYSVSLPVDVNESGAMTYKTFSVSKAGSWKGSVGAFYAAQVSKNTSSMFSLTRESGQTKFLVGVKTLF